ncbi:unnamed protein product [Calypogeia fissa]
MRSLQLSSVIESQQCQSLAVVREFELVAAAKQCSILGRSDLSWRGNMLQSSSFGSTTRLERLTKGHSSERGSSITSRVVCSIISRNSRAAIRCPNTERWSACSVSGRALHGVTAASDGQRLLSVDESTELPSSDGPSLDSNSTPFRKRKVAMWVGYVGTAFKGLQMMRGPEAANTIEYQLERAIYKAGGILETNYGHLDKLSWSRSSRTDKGVHSLSTVIVLKMEIPSTAWVNDPDGLLLADNINAHLPPTIQIFGVVPVTKSFEARRFCSSRTYQYLLPASMIGLSEDLSPEKTGQVLQNFRSILNTFEGRFAFHNYTIRRLYRHESRPKDTWAKHPSRRRTPWPTKPVAAEEILDEDTDTPVEVPVEKMKNSNPFEHLMAYWLENPDPADKLSASHFRRIFDCSCGGLESFGGVQFIRISITGESFMVHQIRKMVATAVAVARGLLPFDIIPLSLCRHARIVLPIAPSEGLVLAKNAFYPFRQFVAPAHERQFLESDVGVSRLKELPRLELTKRMSEKVDLFWRDVLLPVLAAQLDGSLPVWSVWLENLFSGTISESEIDRVRRSYTNWREQSQLRMEAADEAAVSEILQNTMPKVMDPGNGI